MKYRRIANYLFKHRGLDYLFTKRNVFFSYFFLRSFAIFDVRSCAVPSCYVSTFIFDREAIEAALMESRGRVFGPSGAAARLGIARSTLESKIRTLKIDKNRFKVSSPSN